MPIFLHYLVHYERIQLQTNLGCSWFYFFFIMSLANGITKRKLIILYRKTMFKHQ